MPRDEQQRKPQQPGEPNRRVAQSAERQDERKEQQKRPFQK
jgi:hypothetical protein